MGGVGAEVGVLVGFWGVWYEKGELERCGGSLEAKVKWFFWGVSLRVNLGLGVRSG